MSITESYICKVMYSTSPKLSLMKSYGSVGEAEKYDYIGEKWCSYFLGIVVGS